MFCHLFLEKEEWKNPVGVGKKKLLEDVVVNGFYLELEKLASGNKALDNS